MKRLLYQIFPFKHLQEGEFFRLDREWWQKTDVCSAINVFQNNQGQWIQVRGCYKQMEFEQLIAALAKM